MFQKGLRTPDKITNVCIYYRNICRKFDKSYALYATCTRNYMVKYNKSFVYLHKKKYFFKTSADNILFSGRIIYIF